MFGGTFAHMSESWERKERGKGNEVGGNRRKRRREGRERRRENALTSK